MAEQFDHVVVIPDMQYPFQDKRVERAIFEFIKDSRPEKVVIIGDWADFYSLSSFQKRLAPSDRMHLRKELRLAHAALVRLREVAPKARIDYIEGNHEERLFRVLEHTNDELLELSLPWVKFKLDVPTLLGCHELDIGYHKPWPEAGLWLGKPGGIWAYHGKWITQNAWQKNLKEFGHSVIYGHTHRASENAQTRATGRIAAYEVGCGCNFKTTPRTKTPVLNWQHAVGSVYVSRTSKRFDATVHQIVDGSFVVGGKRYGR